MKRGLTLSLALASLASLAPFAACAPSAPPEAVGDRDGGGTMVEVADATSADAIASDSAPPQSLDGSGDGSADSGIGDAGTSPLAQLSGAVLWLESTSGVTLATPGGTTVSGWKDQSSAHNDAAQTTSALQPALISRSGLPALEFSGKNPATAANTGGTGGPYLRVADAPSLNWATDDFTLAVVAAYQNPIDESHLGVIGAFFGKWGKDAGEGQIMFAGNWPHAEHPNVEYSDLYFGFGEAVPAIVTDSRTGFNDDQVRLYVAQRTSAGTVVRVSGQVIETLPSDTVVDVSSVGAAVGIGNFGGDGSARNLDGDVFAVIALHGVTSADDLMTLETYLMSRYPVTPPPVGDGG